MSSTPNTNQSPVDSSKALHSNLARIERKIKKRKRGHITWASMKVIAEIGACISTVLLCFLIASTVAIVTFMPSDISARLNNGMLFFRSINDGYQLALDNMPPSSHSNVSTIKQVISKKVQSFYEFPFEVIREKISTETIQKLFPILAEIPTIMYDVQDMIWYIDAVIREVDVFGSLAPTDYGVQSKRNFPCLLS